MSEENHVQATEDGGVKPVSKPGGDQVEAQAEETKNDTLTAPPEAEKGEDTSSEAESSVDADEDAEGEKEEGDGEVEA